MNSKPHNDQVFRFLEYLSISDSNFQIRLLSLKILLEYFSKDSYHLIEILWDQYKHDFKKAKKIKRVVLSSLLDSNKKLEFLINYASRLEDSYHRFKHQSFGVKKGNYSKTENPNTQIIRIGDLTLYYSYETIVAFRHYSIGFVITESFYSKTTGKHLTLLDPDKSIRIPYDQFKKRLEEIMVCENIF